MGKKQKKNPTINQSNTKVYYIIAIIGCIFSVIFSYLVSAWGYANTTLESTGQFGQIITGSKPTIFKCIGAVLDGNIVIGIPDIGILLKTFGIFGGGIIIVMLIALLSHQQKEAQRDGHEHGKEHIATQADYQAFKRDFTDPNGDNVLFSEHVALSMDNKATNRVTNTLIIGGTGTGKTFRYIKPNIAQLNCSRVITDPSGDIFNDFSAALIEQGKNVYLFNIKDFALSNHYNPLLNVYDADGNIDPQKVDILVDLYMENASEGKEQGGNDPFWPKSEKAFLTAVIYYVLENDDISKEDKCFHTVLEKVQLARADENAKKSRSDDGGGETLLTKEIREWQGRMEAEGRKIMTPLYYDTFLIAPAKTANTILITTAVDLQIFSNPNVDRITRYNSRYPDLNIDLDNIAMTESYLFLSIPQDNKAFNFLVAMIYSQLFSRLYVLGESILCHKWLICKHRGLPVVNPFDKKEDAERFIEEVTEDNIIELPYINGTSIYYLVWNKKVYKRSFSKTALINLLNELDKDIITESNEYWGQPALPMRVEFMLDEFKNIGEIPNFDTIIATCRKYRIGVHVVIQDIAQLKELYPNDSHQTILANVDTTLFLGSPLPEDIEYIQKKLGKTTIKQRSTSSQKTGVSTSYTPTEVDLMSLDEIKAINRGRRNDCIVMIRDIVPFVDRKLSFLDHPNFKLLKQANINAKIYFENNKENAL